MAVGGNQINLSVASAKLTGAVANISVQSPLDELREEVKRLRETIESLIDSLAWRDTREKIKEKLENQNESEGVH